jgi:hypothetical protein
MTGKTLLTVSLLLPFMAISSVVHADATTTKKRHWASEPRITSFSSSSRAQTVPEGGGGHGAGVESCAYQYQGGPKSNLWTCRSTFQPTHSVQPTHSGGR